MLHALRQGSVAVRTSAFPQIAILNIRETTAKTNESNPHSYRHNVKKKELKNIYMLPAMYEIRHYIECVGILYNA